MEKKRLIEVAVAAPLDKTFYYTVPEDPSSKALIGMRVIVPFGKRTVTGYIVGLPESLPEGMGETVLKDVRDIPDPDPSFTPEMLRFYRWIADYYISPLGEVIKAALPASRGKARAERFVTIAGSTDQLPMTPKEVRLFSFIRERGRVSMKELNSEFGRASEVVKRLCLKGLVAVTEEEISRSPCKGAGVGAYGRTPLLTEPQKEAVSRIIETLDRDGFSPFLLHGVTGSGKTEVYLRVIEEALRRGKGAIVLVPEISLTPQLLNRFRSRFGEKVAALHSALSDGERHDEWRRIRRGEARIVVGVRSAIFSPVSDLGVIVVDEEHDHSYKQEESPRYNARDLAIVRGKMAGGIVILGSATPSMESYHNAVTGRYGYIKLPARIGERPMPDVSIVDMRDVGKRQAFSRQMAEHLEGSLDIGRQAILFLNRRGFSTFLICSDCGFTFGCPNCSISLIYHQGEGLLRCHYCDYSQKAFPLCPKCKGGNVGLLGLGTERVEGELRRLFPNARIARMDRDTVSRKGSHERILKGLEDREVDILIGTQMVTKGHDYPGVTMVGVISADTSLNLPDFRAAERTFQLITQVAGRAGRGDIPGNVVIQTFNPDHYSIMAAVSKDMDVFYREEMEFRRELKYPPLSRLIILRIRGNSEKRTSEAAGILGRICRDESRNWKGVDILGPAKSPIYKMRGKYRWQVLLKGRESRALHSLARCVISRARGDPDLKVVDMQVDVDPLSML
jgi:primosomal protein N' (replication factor Y)